MAAAEGLQKFSEAVRALALLSSSTITSISLLVGMEPGMKRSLERVSRSVSTRGLRATGLSMELS